MEDLCLSVWCLECCTDLWASLSSGSHSRPYCLRKQTATALSLIQIKTSRKTIMSHCKQKPSGWSSGRSHPTGTAGLCFFIENLFIDLLLSTSSWFSVTVLESKVQKAVLYFCLVIRLLIIHTLFWLLEIFLMFFCNWVWWRMQRGTSPSLQECLWSGWRMVCYSHCSLFLRRKQRTYRKSSILLGIDQYSQDVLRWVWGSQNRDSTDPVETNR